jgi:hypothetical protein
MAQGALDAEEDHALTINLYFKNELLLILKRAGFADLVVEGDDNDAVATSDDDFIVFIAKPGVGLSRGAPVT